jgi:hypothetical protein
MLALQLLYVGLGVEMIFVILFQFLFACEIQEQDPLKKQTMDLLTNIAGDSKIGKCDVKVTNRIECGAEGKYSFFTEMYITDRGRTKYLPLVITDDNITVDWLTIRKGQLIARHINTEENPHMTYEVGLRFNKSFSKAYLVYDKYYDEHHPHRRVYVDSINCKGPNPWAAAEEDNLVLQGRQGMIQQLFNDLTLNFDSDEDSEPIIGD